MSKFSQLFISLLVGCVLKPYLVNGLDSHRYYLENRRPSSLSFSAGDVLACRIDSNVGSTIYGAEHVMLALDSSNVAHITDISSDTTRGSLKEDNFVQMANSKGYKACRVATYQYDRIMMEKGVSSKKNPYTAACDARRDVGDRVYYNLFGCNCQHWVTYWKYGKAWSAQSNQPPNSECRLHNHFVNWVSANANSYNDNGQLSAMAGAGVGEMEVGTGPLVMKWQGPSVGANADLGQHRTGVGFKASLGEIRRDLGNGFGASWGLAADTYIGAGRDGYGVQVLGSGVVHSKSKGTKFCILGSCVYFG